MSDHLRRAAFEAIKAGADFASETIAIVEMLAGHRAVQLSPQDLARTAIVRTMEGRIATMQRFVDILTSSDRL